MEARSTFIRKVGPLCVIPAFPSGLRKTSKNPRDFGHSLLQCTGFFSSLHGPEQVLKSLRRFNRRLQAVHYPMSLKPTPFYRIQCSSERRTVQVSKNFTTQFEFAFGVRVVQLHSPLDHHILFKLQVAVG
jgi:hypothetical protein